MRPTAFFAAALAALAGRVPSQDVEASAAIDALLEELRSAHDVTALGACVLRDGRLVALGAVGERSRGSEVLVTADDRWHLGSCTKAMTATLCGMLVDDRALDLDTPLPKLFPDVAAGINPDFAAVSLRDLLRHRAGLPANPTLERPLGGTESSEGSLRDLRASVAKAQLGRAPAVRPGEFSYSNTGYILVGAALEQQSGKSWEDLIQERLLGPLGMESAGFGAPGTADHLDQPLGHLRPSRSARAVPVPIGPGADNPPAWGPAGTVHASLRDWSKFIALQIGSDGHEPPLISAASLDALRRTPKGGDYACGFAVTRRAWADGPILTHTGSNNRWFAVVWCAPREHFAVMAVCNEGGDPAAAATDAACAALISRFGPKVDRPKRR